MAALTEDEMELLNLLADFWNKFSQLPDQHEMEVTEVAQGIHALQRIVAARPTFRALKAVMQTQTQTSSLSVING